MRTYVWAVPALYLAVAPIRTEAAGLTAQDATIVEAYVAADGGMQIVLSDGKRIQPPKEKAQVGCSSPLTSEDRQAVGWLVNSDFCCTSYPISLTLVVYRLGTFAPISG